MPVLESATLLAAALSATLAAAPDLSSTTALEAPPGALEAALSVAAEASLGQSVTVTLTVTNTGSQPVTDPRPRLGCAGPAGRFHREPPLPEPLAAGEGRVFVWTFEPDEPGDIVFTASVEGRSGDHDLAAGARAVMRAVRPAALETGLSVSATVAAPGEWVTLAVTVSNTGGAAATGVLLPMPSPSTSRLAPVRGPLRIAVDRLGPGSSTGFSWTWSVSGAGSASFFLRPAARDANSGKVVVAALVESGRVRLLRPAALKLEHVFLLPNPVVRPGEFVEATLVISNLGESSALVSKVDIKETRSSSDSLGPPTLRSPQVPFDVPGGDSRSVVWAYRVGPGGNAKVAASIEGRDAVNGATLKCPPVFSNRVLISSTILR